MQRRVSCGDMSRTDSLSALLSNNETRSASTSLLLVGIVLGGSAATAAYWARSRLYIPWRRQVISRQAREIDADSKLGFVCVLDGLSKSHRQDAIKVASCFGVASVWVSIDRVGTFALRFVRIARSMLQSSRVNTLLAHA